MTAKTNTTTSKKPFFGTPNAISPRNANKYFRLTLRGIQSSKNIKKENIVHEIKKNNENIV